MRAEIWSEGWESSQLGCSAVDLGSVGITRLSWENRGQTCWVKQASNLIFTPGTMGDIWRIEIEEYSDLKICVFKRLY